MATTRLKLYNGALLLCAERSIATLTDAVESRRLLDEVWNDGGVRFCLEQGQWKFAMCGAKFSYNTAIVPAWGYSRAFAKPTDWCVTSAVCSDEYFQVPLTQYRDEAGYWYADQDEIYVDYVSDAATYGGDLAKWPASFTEYVKAYFASRIVTKLSGDEKRREAILHPRTGILAQNLLIAKNRDAMSDPSKFPPTGSWAKARMGGRYRGRFGDGGSSGSLIG